MINFLFFNQLNAMDCGPTCLRMVAKFYGKSLSIEKLRQAAQLSKEGVSLLGISEAAETIGFKTRGVKITFAQLLVDTPKPVILHWGQNHFVVMPPANKEGILKTLFQPKSKRKGVWIADPAKEMIWYTNQEFLNHWASTTDGNEPIGIALLIEPTPDFYKQEDEPDTKVGWGMLLGYLHQQKRYIIQLFIGLLVGSLLQLIFPFLTQSIVDTGINTHNLQFIYIVLAA